MKILLDECVPWPIHKLLAGHECLAAQQCGWGGIKNGDLLQLAEGKFDLFVTADQNLRYQQSLAGRRIAILELSTNKLRRLEAAAPLDSNGGCNRSTRRLSQVGNSLKFSPGPWMTVGRTARRNLQNFIGVHLLSMKVFADCANFPERDCVRSASRSGWDGRLMSGRAAAGFSDTAALLSAVASAVLCLSAAQRSVFLICLGRLTERRLCFEIVGNPLVSLPRNGSVS